MSITNVRLVTAIKGGQFPKAKVSPMFIDIKWHYLEKIY